MGKDRIGQTLTDAIERRRGYAEFFDCPDKFLKEWGVAHRFIEELERNHGAIIESINQHPGGENHAPDILLVTKSGEVWGVEITELVSSDAIVESRRGNTVLAEWPGDELISKFYVIIARKDEPEKVRGGPYDR